MKKTLLSTFKQYKYNAYHWRHNLNCSHGAVWSGVGAGVGLGVYFSVFWKKKIIKINIFNQKQKSISYIIVTGFGVGNGVGFGVGLGVGFYLLFISFYFLLFSNNFKRNAKRNKY